MSILNIFTKKAPLCPINLEEATKAAIETPKQLDRLEKKLKELEERLVKELREGGCKAAS